MATSTSRLTEETKRCLVRLTDGDQGGLVGAFVFPPGYLGFAGHFPENPVLPGVCMVQAAVVLQEAWHHVPVTLMDVVSAKWMAPVKPGNELTFETDAPHAGAAGLPGMVIKTRVSCLGEKVAELVLRVVGLPATQGGTP
jgi:3-hydroxymyristoyl/3-hydroxydecanoyl-(acyl carrier protein) dehydratase